ncbi:MAG TPA: ABC transporter substrate-binding protein [Devosia sp.]|nr:ABC transporter substrate-binding protein [Devosia sp.]
MRMFKALAGVALGVALATSSAALAATPKDTLVIADAIDDVITLDPGEVSEVAGVLVSQQLYQPLVTFDINDPTKIIPVLAKSWEVSADGKTFTFKMNRDAKFSSGNPVTAHDAEFSLQRPVLLNTRISFILTQFGFTKDNVKDRIKALDDDTLQFTVDQQYAPSFVLYVLSSYTGGIVDSKTVMAHDTNGDLGNAWLKQANSAGSGPYVLTKWEPKQSILLSKNPNFWQTPPGVSKLFIQQMPESATERLALEKGDIDVANKLGPDDFAALKDNKDITVQQGNDTTIYYFGLNLRNENLKNPKVVEAIKYLVDYQGIADTIGKGNVKVHQTMIPDGFLGGGINYTPYKLDIDKAKQLLADSGVKLPFTLDTVVWNVPPYPDYAQAVQSTLAQAGINLNLQVVDGQQWLDRYRSHSLDIWFGLWGPDYPDPQSNAKTFTVNDPNDPDGKGNLADRFGWNSGDLSNQVLAAVKEQDVDKRRAQYEAIEKAQADASPFVYMFQGIRKVAVRNNVKGLVLGFTYSDDRYGAVSKE